MKHKHADLMLQFALDAMETDKPWKRWQVTVKTGWESFHHDFSFNPDREYRRHPDAPPVPWHLLNKSTRSADVSKKPKPIDLSVCIESGIDCEFYCPVNDDWRPLWKPEVVPLLSPEHRKVRPRLNHWMAWMGGKCPLPEGLMVDLRRRNETITLKDNPADFAWNWVSAPCSPDRDIIAFRVTGLADGYWWPYKLESAS